jgi:hypothetical protein
MDRVTQGPLVGCPEEVAFTKGFISADDLRGLAARFGRSEYGRYCKGSSMSRIINGRINNPFRNQDENAPSARLP